jgi:hypothetical protein
MPRAGRLKPGLTGLLLTSKSQGARAHSDYFLCPPGNGAITTTLPSQAGPPAVAPARGDATVLAPVLPWLPGPFFWVAGTEMRHA